MAILFFLVVLHSFAVKYSEPNKVECIAEQQRLHLLVVWTRAAQTGCYIDLEEPWSQLLVDYHIEAVDLEAL